jgi:hypothetical protein
MSTFERHPVLKRPGYDCWKDNANCPSCSVGRRGDHGRSGGLYWFTVSTDVDGRRVALVLEVLGIHYPPTVELPENLSFLRKPRGAVLAIHRETVLGGQVCEFLNGRGCDSEIGGYLRASEIYEQFGNMTTDSSVDLSEQSEAFWTALELQLDAWKAPTVSAAATVH